MSHNNVTDLPEVLFKKRKKSNNSENDSDLIEGNRKRYKEEPSLTENVQKYPTPQEEPIDLSRTNQESSRVLQWKYPYTKNIWNPEGHLPSTETRASSMQPVQDLSMPGLERNSYGHRSDSTAQNMDMVQYHSQEKLDQPIKNINITEIDSCGSGPKSAKSTLDNHYDPFEITGSLLQSNPPLKEVQRARENHTLRKEAIVQPFKNTYMTQNDLQGRETQSVGNEHLLQVNDQMGLDKSIEQIDQQNNVPQYDTYDHMQYTDSLIVSAPAGQNRNMQQIDPEMRISPPWQPPQINSNMFINQPAQNNKHINDPMWFVQPPVENEHFQHMDHQNGFSQPPFWNKYIQHSDRPKGLNLQGPFDYIQQNDRPIEIDLRGSHGDIQYNYHQNNHIQQHSEAIGENQPLSDQQFNDSYLDSENQSTQSAALLQNDSKELASLEDKKALILWSDPQWRVVQPAQEDPRKSASVPSLEAEAAYISQEFLNLSQQSSSSKVISVPRDFHSQQQERSSEAERKVFDWLKGLDIDGLKVVFFHGLRYQGSPEAKDDEEEKAWAREIDYSVFCEYNGKKFLILLEVKSCDETTERKQLYNHRRRRQLIEHVAVLKNCQKLSEEQASNIQLREVWPNLKSNDIGASYLLENKQKPRKWYVFKDDSFIEKIRSIISNPNYAIPDNVWKNIMCHHTRQSCGVLYNYFSYEFTLLGQDQVNLLASGEHPMNKPVLVEGRAGTGKTLTEISKIKQLYQDGKIAESKQVVCFTFSDHMKQLLLMYLEQYKVDLTHITIVNYKKSDKWKDFYKTKSGMMKLLKEYAYIFIDEAEDLGIEELEKICRVISNEEDFGEYFAVEKSIYGLFWILFDPYQSQQDTHSLEVDSSSSDDLIGNLKWKGRYFKGNDDIKKLRTVFRMTRNNVSLIHENHILPAETNTTTMVSHKIDGVKFPAVIKIISNSTKIKPEIEKFIEKGTEDSFVQKNIHPHKTAFLLDTKDFNKLFEKRKNSGITNFIEKINKKFERKMKNENNARKITTNLSESLLKDPGTLKEDPFQCGCMFYVGTVDSVKGLTIPIVHYIVISSTKKDISQLKNKEEDTQNKMYEESPHNKICKTRTSSYYAALSRSSSEFHLLELQLESTGKLSNPWQNYLGMIENHNLDNPNDPIDTNIQPITEDSKIVNMFGVVACNLTSWIPCDNNDLISFQPKSVQISTIDKNQIHHKKFPTVSVVCMDVTKNYVAAGTATGVIHIWTTKDFSSLLTFGEGNKQWKHDNVCIKFSRGGSYLAVCHGKEVIIHRCGDNWNKPIRLSTISTNAYNYKYISWKSDNILSLCTRSDGSRSIETYNLPDAELQKRHQVGGDSIRDIEWNPAGDQLASLCDMYGSYKLKIWSLDSSTPKHTLDSEYTRELCWSPTGTSLATHNYYYKTIELWNTNTWQIIHTINNNFDIKGIKFSTDGSLLAAWGRENYLSSNNKVTIWNVSSGASATNPVNSHTWKDVYSVGWSPGGDMLAVAHDDGVSVVKM